MAKTSLVIVESPAKAKTIGKYLGPAYQVKACMGHLRDLPKSTLGVDIDHDFEPNYRPIKGKEDIISDLKKSAKSRPGRGGHQLASEGTAGPGRQQSPPGYIQRDYQARGERIHCRAA